MEETVITNPFKDYLLKKNETVNSFAKRSGISASTLYPIYHGRPMHRRIAVKICRHARDLALQDFGFER
jgi:predicted transcriptional regulator